MTQLSYKNHVKKFRLKASLSRAELAQKLGISKGSIVNWECGRNSLSEENIQKLLKIFGITKRELIEL